MADGPLDEDGAEAPSAQQAADAAGAGATDDAEHVVDEPPAESGSGTMSADAIAALIAAEAAAGDEAGEADPIDAEIVAAEVTEAEPAAPAGGGSLSADEIVALIAAEAEDADAGDFTAAAVPALIPGPFVEDVVYAELPPVHAPLEEIAEIDLLLDVPLRITVELGQASKTIRELLELGQGSILHLSRHAGEPVDVLVNGQHIARGEVVVIDENFGVRVTEVVAPAERLRTMAA